MAGLALYRKYRSADFAGVIGQEHVVKTLQAQLASGSVSHAYLFTGPRGVGKTSVARLLARALNCTGVQLRPCNQCASCQAVLSSTMDIIEIDAASNNSVDDVRELRDKISLAPAVGKYKVYIIDEVHMLSSGAFNALLKTLEEPPAHAVFILATTESHKIPATVISRAQNYAFKPIGHSDIVSHLQSIATAEGVTIDDDGLAVIASVAGGGFRDAISLLDQVAAGSVGVPITAATVRQQLGQGDAAQAVALAHAIAAGSAPQALSLLMAIVDSGAQPTQIALQQATLWRQAMRVAAGVLGHDAAVAQLASTVTAQLCAQALDQFLLASKSPWPDAALETAIVRLCLPQPVKMGPAVKSPAPAPVAPPSSPVAAPPDTNDVAPTNQPSSPTGPAVSAQLEQGKWPKVLVQLKQHHNSLSALLQMYPTDFSGDTVVVRSRFNFHRDLFNKPQNRQIIEQAASKVYGRPVSVTAITDEVAAAASKPSRAAAKAVNADLTAAALEILGGEVIE